MKTHEDVEDQGNISQPVVEKTAEATVIDEVAQEASLQVIYFRFRLLRK